MYFSVGGHPAFSCPFFENESYDDYFIEFEQTENSNRWNVLPDGTIHPISEDYLEDSSKINLTHSLFSKDALIFKDLKSKKVKLKSSKHLTSVELTFNDFEYLGIWAKPEGDFVCVEPWLGISDSSQSNHLIEEKEGIISLLPNNDFISNYKITIKEGTLS
jgi:galactose mutarotase-like enzyme